MATGRYAIIESPLGRIFVAGDERQLYYLQFEDCAQLPERLQQFQALLGQEIVQVPAWEIRSLASSTGRVHALFSIAQELELYFAGKLQEFKTPVALLGTNFQRSVWQQLTTIPYGHSISYKALAAGVGKPTGYRAAANANGANNFVILVPCHRVIAHDGGLGGYSSGIERKKWLLAHEKRMG
jgi:AraC family transcriptional regulator of adaptative response/methylated-DNA-[protein]-cysteine methyltransferase